MKTKIVQQTTRLQLSEAYSEAAEHLENCALEESDELQRQAYRLVADMLYAKASSRLGKELKIAKKQ